MADDKPTKAVIKNLDTGEEIKCLFNPTEYTVQKSNSWQPKQVVGKNVPELQFGGGGARTLTMELLLDAYEPQSDGRTSVKDDVDKLFNLTLIDPGEKNSTTQRSKPPTILFQWGGTWTCKAVITNLSVRYVLFRQDGTPVRAIANVTLQEAEDVTVQEGQNPTSRAMVGYRRREVRPRDTLQLISYEEYGDPTLWRKIASANKIDDPSLIRAGDVLAIPPLN